jgi:hypothetical protein
MSSLVALQNLSPVAFQWELAGFLLPNPSEIIIATFDSRLLFV